MMENGLNERDIFLDKQSGKNSMWFPPSEELKDKLSERFIIMMKKGGSFYPLIFIHTYKQKITEVAVK